MLDNQLDISALTTSSQRRIGNTFASPFLPGSPEVGVSQTERDRARETEREGERERERQKGTARGERDRDREREREVANEKCEPIAIGVLSCPLVVAFSIELLHQIDIGQWQRLAMAVAVASGSGQWQWMNVRASFGLV